MGNKQVSIDTLPKEDHGYFIWGEGARLAKNRHKPLAIACTEADQLATRSGKRVFIVEVIGCVIPGKPASEAPKIEKGEVVQ